MQEFDFGLPQPGATVPDPTTQHIRDAALSEVQVEQADREAARAAVRGFPDLEAEFESGTLRPLLAISLGRGRRNALAALGVFGF